MRKIVLHSRSGYRPELDALIEQFKTAGVIFVGVVGVDCSRIEDIVDELCVGDGNAETYSMLTSSHPGESVDEALEFARSLTAEFEGDVQLVEF